MKKRPSPKPESLYRQITPAELRKGDLRKLEILRATLACVAKHGWAGTNYESVGKICGLKRPHVAYHYPTWNTLIDSAIRFAYAAGASIVGDRMNSSRTRADRLRAYIEGTFEWLESHPEHSAVISLLWHLASFDPHYRTLTTEFRELGTGRVYAILTDGSPIDPKSTHWKKAVAIHALVVGHCVTYVSDQRIDAKTIAAAALEGAKDILR